MYFNNMNVMSVMLFVWIFYVKVSRVTCPRTMLRDSYFVS